MITVGPLSPFFVMVKWPRQSMITGQLILQDLRLKFLTV